MKVFWEQSEDNSLKLPGRKQRIDLDFVYAGKQRKIPYAYRFDEGTVFDILTILDEEEMRAYYDKYVDVEDTLSAVQRRAAESAHPYQSVLFSQIIINNNRADGWSATTKYHMPWMREEYTLCNEQRKYANYLKDASCFVCDRVVIPHVGGTSSNFRRLYRYLLPRRINKIEIRLETVSRFYPLEMCFELPGDYSGVHTERFTHPKTKEQHTLYFQNIEVDQITVPFISDGKKLYVAQLGYEIEPELPDNSQLLFGSAVLHQDKKQDGRFVPDSMSSIGIIGGSDGPTSIFYDPRAHNEQKLGLHGLCLHICLARPAVEQRETIEVALDGIIVEQFGSRELVWQIQASR